MGTKYKHEGDVLDHTAGSDISADDVVELGDSIGIALVDIANGEEGAVAVEGVFTVDKATGTAWSQGDKLDWDTSAGKFSKGITPASGDITSCGIAAADAASADATGLIKLTPGTGSVN